MSEEKHERPDPELWVERYGDYLFKYAMLRLGDQASAEDVVQETLLAAFKNYERFDGRVELRFWLRGILKNKVVDYLRKSMREIPSDYLEDLDESEGKMVRFFGVPTSKPKPWEFEPQKAFERKEFWEVFNGCLSKLRSPMREIFMLKELEGVATSELCKEFDVTPNNVWVILHRARNQLKECLETNWINRD